MVNKIINAISAKLFETFGADYTIYTENVEQYLQEPCFYIEIVAVSINQIVASRYNSNNSFDVQFFTKSNETKKDLRIYRCMQSCRPQHC